MPTYSFDSTLATDRDEVRDRLGLVGDYLPVVSNEYIDAVLTKTGNVLAAVGRIAGALIAQYAQRPDRVALESGLSVSFGNILKVWEQLWKSYGVTVDAAADSTSYAFAVQPARADGYSEAATDEL